MKVSYAHDSIMVLAACVACCDAWIHLVLFSRSNCSKKQQKITEILSEKHEQPAVFFKYLVGFVDAVRDGQQTGTFVPGIYFGDQHTYFPHQRSELKLGVFFSPFILDPSVGQQAK